MSSPPPSPPPPSKPTNRKAKAPSKPPAAPTRQLPARRTRNPRYANTADAPGAAAASSTPSGASGEGKEDDMDVDVPRPQSPSYAEIVRGQSPGVPATGGSSSVVGPHPGTPPPPSSIARGSAAASRPARQVLDFVAVPSLPPATREGTSQRRSQRGAHSAPAESSSSSETGSDFEPPPPSASDEEEEEEESAATPKPKPSAKRAREPPSPTTATLPPKKRRGAASREPVQVPQAQGNKVDKRARSPDAARVMPAQKRSKDNAGRAQPSAAIKGGGRLEGGKEGKAAKEGKVAKAAKNGEGVGGGGESRGGKEKRGPAKGDAKDASQSNGGGYMPPMSPPRRPLQLIDFDEDDFRMPTPPPKVGNGKTPALNSLNERDTPPPSPTRKAKKSKSSAAPPPLKKDGKVGRPSASNPAEHHAGNKGDGKKRAPPLPPPPKKSKGREDISVDGNNALGPTPGGKKPAPPPPPPPKKGGGGDDGDADDDEDAGDNDPRPSKKAKGKQKAQPEDQVEDARPRASQKAKGKQRAQPEDEDAAAAEDAFLHQLPGVFNTGDFLDDDAELPDFSQLFSFDGDPNDEDELDLDEPGPSTRRIRNPTRSATSSTAGTSTTHGNAGPSATQGTAGRANAGPIPGATAQRLQDAVRALSEMFMEESIKCKKPIEALWNAAGWRSLECMRTRQWTRQQVFSRHWAALNPPINGESKDERRARMNKAYKKKLARLGANPTDEQLAEHFKADFDFCAAMQEEMIQNATARQRQRLVNQTAEQLSRVALGAHMNSGLALVGYVVDLRGGAKGSVSSTMFGGGAAFVEMLRRYRGNFTAGMNDVTTLLRSCDLRLRGLTDDTEISTAPATEEESAEARAWRRAIEADMAAHPRGFFTYRNMMSRPGKNRSDEFVRILYEAIRWDLGANYRLANHHLSSKSVEMPNQIPRSQLLDIAYRLGLVLANWIEELANNMPIKDVPRKPSGRSWAGKVGEMLERRKKAERESNELGLEGVDALQYLLDHGAVVLMPLPRNAVMGPLRELSMTPLVQSNPVTQHQPPRVYGYLRWKDSELYQHDLATGSDSRIKWQSFWEDERDDGLVHDEDEGEEEVEHGEYAEENAQDGEESEGNGEEDEGEDAGEGAEADAEDKETEETEGEEEEEEEEDEDARAKRARVEALYRARRKELQDKNSKSKRR
ncbi:hypothetical protein FB107DRAFT_275843 [Schizophyllum commune]